MNLIDEINNNDSFIIIRAWRLSPNCPGCDRETSEIVYENDIRETQKQVLEIINGIRSKSSQWKLKQMPAMDENESKDLYIQFFYFYTRQNFSFIFFWNTV